METQPSQFISFKQERWRGHVHLTAYSGVTDFVSSVRFEDATLAVARHKFSAGMECGRADFEDGVALMSVICSNEQPGCGGQQINRWLERVKPLAGWPEPDLSPLRLRDEDCGDHVHQVGRPLLPVGDVCADRILGLVSSWDSYHSQTERHIMLAPFAPPDREGTAEWLVIVCAVSGECVMKHVEKIAGESREVRNIEEMRKEGSISPSAVVRPVPPSG